MSFANLGNRGHANSKSTASISGGSYSKITVTPNQTIPVGSLVVVWAAGDSTHDPSAGDGDPISFRANCTDTAGNIYTTIAGGTDGQSNIYSQCFIFVALVQVAITTSHTIDVLQDVGVLNQTAPRAMSVEEFSVDSDKVWAVADRNPQKVTDRATDPAAITWSGGQTGREYLILHALSAEGPETDAYTWDSDYTQITGDGTTGGTADSNIHLRGGWRIASITSDTVDVTSTTADRDYTQVLQAITEIGSRRRLSFPRNSTILDDFNRADENPVGNGDWDTGSNSPRSNGATTRHLRITSNQLRDSSASPGIGGSWYTGGAFSDVFICDGFDVFMTFATVGEATLSMRGSGRSENATADGIAVAWDTGVAGLNSLEFGSLGNAGLVDQRRGRGWTDMGAGWKVGISMVRVDDFPTGTVDENYVYYWINKGSGWQILFAIHGFNGAFVGYDSNTQVLVGVGIDGTATRIDDLGGGPTYGWCQGAFKPQIFRRAYGDR